MMVVVVMRWFGGATRQWHRAVVVVVVVNGGGGILRPRWWNMCTMVENRKKHRQNSHLIIHFPTSEGVSEVSERANE